MNKAFIYGFILVLAAALGTSAPIVGTRVARAQNVVPPGGVPSHDLPAGGSAGLRTGHITATGETVPNPGASLSAGTTPMDLGVQRQDNRIDNSICRGC